jgi:E3 ubiquitin-protein ligase makorin
MCPFGKDCFYQHLQDDGTRFVFKDGVDRSMKVIICGALKFST